MAVIKTFPEIASAEGVFLFDVPQAPDNITAKAAINLTAPLAYVPSAGELGAVIDGNFVPLRSQFPASTVTGPRSADAPVPVQAAVELADVFPTARRLGTTVCAPEIWPYNRRTTSYRTVILDTPLHADTPDDEKADPFYIENPGIRLLSATHLDFPTSDPDAVPLFYDAASYEWLATSTWTKTGDGEGTLALAATQGYISRILWTYGDGDPDTEYTDPIEISETKAVRFRLCMGPGPGAGSGEDREHLGPINTAHIVFSGLGVAPASFSTNHPIISLTDDPATLALDGSENHEGVQYRWNFKKGASAQTQTPHAQRRIASPYTEATATGHVYLDAFLPYENIGEAPQYGTLKATAYRYGMTPSASAQYIIRVRVGKLTATWDGVNQLTLAASVSGATIYYGLDDPACPNTYSGPLTITTTKTVYIYAWKSNYIGSNVFPIPIVFSGTTPPEAFVAKRWSTPEFSEWGRLGTAADGYAGNYDPGTRDLFLAFHRRPDYYVSPSGTGDGKSPAAPCSFATMVADTTTGLIVWACEGDYALTANLALKAGTVVFGGFSTDYLERDATNRKTRFTGTESQAAYQLTGSAAMLDGIWFEYTDIVLTSSTTALAMANVGTMVNCHVSITSTDCQMAPDNQTGLTAINIFTGSLLQDCSLEMDLGWSGRPFYALRATLFSGSCYRCSSTVRIVTSDADTGGGGTTRNELQADLFGSAARVHGGAYEISLSSGDIVSDSTFPSSYHRHSSATINFGQTGTAPLFYDVDLVATATSGKGQDQAANPDNYFQGGDSRAWISIKGNLVRGRYDFLTQSGEPGKYLDGLTIAYNGVSRSCVSLAGCLCDAIWTSEAQYTPIENTAAHARVVFNQTNATPTFLRGDEVIVEGGEANLTSSASITGWEAWLGGNPVRKDIGSLPATVPGYFSGSGSNNTGQGGAGGDGVPLDGYETAGAGGTGSPAGAAGTVRGIYWE